MPVIDQEFRELIPPLSKGEREALRLSIQQDGVRDPVVLWGEIVVDGHNRHEIATELGVAYPTAQRDFADREAVRQWILDNQCARRNLTPDQVVAIAALRGVDPPPAFRGLPAGVLVREVLAGGGSLARVVAGKQTARTAHNDMRRARGETLRRPRRLAPAAAASAPAAPPLEAVRAKRETQAQTSTERRAIRDALDRIAELETQLHVIEHENSTPLPAVPRLQLTGTRRSGAAVALLSDVHAGAVVEQSHSSYGNRYSPAICRYRVRRWFAGVAWHVKAYREVAWDLRHLVLWFGGDMVDGHLHRDSQETSQTCIEAIDWLEPILVDGVRGLREELDCDVDLVMSYGNHPRDTKKPCRARGAAHNHEWGMYQRIARQLDGVQCLADPTAHQYHRVFDYELHFHHGDETNYGGGVGGISIPLNKAFAQWDKVRHADLHHIGHWHQQLDGGRWLANGCVKGYDPYAMSVKGTPEPPQQTFYVLDEKRGKTAVTPLWVSDPIDEARL